MSKATCQRDERKRKISKVEPTDERMIRRVVDLIRLMCIAFFLYEAFKEDVCWDIVPITSYPNTLRRKVIDIAAKIVCGGRTLKLKVSRAVWEALDFAELWANCHIAPCVCLE